MSEGKKPAVANIAHMKALACTAQFTRYDAQSQPGMPSGNGEIPMNRLVLAALLSTSALGAHASPDTCRVHGVAYDYAGRPFPEAVVRLIDRQSHRVRYRATDARGAFAFDDPGPSDGGRDYRLDVLSSEIVVTGTHIRTRSILGIAAPFACGGSESARVDVRVQVP